MVGSGLLIHCTHLTHLLHYQPIHCSLQFLWVHSIYIYTLEATIILQVRHHQNDIDLTQRILDIHMNVYHAMYFMYIYHAVMCM